MSFGKNLKAARERAKLTQADVGNIVDVSSQAVSQWERGETAPELDKIPALARRLGVSEGWLLSANPATLPQIGRHPNQHMVRVKGYVGAGAEAHFYAVSQGDLDEVPAPPGATDATVAVEVRGDSLGPLFDRSLVFYDDVRRPVTNDLLGHLCVVGLADDRVLVKRLKAGRKGLFRLESATGPVIEDVAVEWAARVRSVIPR